jgi:hypothetical protein
MHERREIREAVKARLLALPGALYGARVFESRIVPLMPTVELPAVAVYTDSETVRETSKDTAPRVLTRDLQLVVECYARARDDVEDALDALALQVETAMDADLYLGNAARYCMLLSTEILINPQGDRPMGIARLTYAIEYESQLRVEPVLDDLETVDTRYDQGGVQAPADEAHDIITGLNT